jgi:hypothetical protein
MPFVNNKYIRREIEASKRDHAQFIARHGTTFEETKEIADEMRAIGNRDVERTRRIYEQQDRYRKIAFERDFPKEITAEEIARLPPREQAMHFEGMFAQARVAHAQISKVLRKYVDSLELEDLTPSRAGPRALPNASQIMAMKPADQLKALIDLQKNYGRKTGLQLNQDIAKYITDLRYEVHSQEELIARNAEFSLQTKSEQIKYLRSLKTHAEDAHITMDFKKLDESIANLEREYVGTVNYNFGEFGSLSQGEKYAALTQVREQAYGLGQEVSPELENAIKAYEKVYPELRPIIAQNRVLQEPTPFSLTRKLASSRKNALEGNTITPIAPPERQQESLSIHVAGEVLNRTALAQGRAYYNKAANEFGSQTTDVAETVRRINARSGQVDSSTPEGRRELDYARSAKIYARSLRASLDRPHVQDLSQPNVLESKASIAISDVERRQLILARDYVKGKFPVRDPSGAAGSQYMSESDVVVDLSAIGKEIDNLNRRIAGASDQQMALKRELTEQRNIRVTAYQFISDVKNRVIAQGSQRMAREVNILGENIRDIDARLSRGDEFRTPAQLRSEREKEVGSLNYIENLRKNVTARGIAEAFEERINAAQPQIPKEVILTPTQIAALPRERREAELIKIRDKARATATAQRNAVEDAIRQIHVEYPELPGFDVQRLYGKDKATRQQILREISDYAASVGIRLPHSYNEAMRTGYIGGIAPEVAAHETARVVSNINGIESRGGNQTQRNELIRSITENLDRLDKANAIERAEAKRFQVFSFKFDDVPYGVIQAFKGLSVPEKQNYIADKIRKSQGLVVDPSSLQNLSDSLDAMGEYERTYVPPRPSWPWHLNYSNGGYGEWLGYTARNPGPKGEWDFTDGATKWQMGSRVGDIPGWSSKVGGITTNNGFEDSQIQQAVMRWNKEQDDSYYAKVRYRESQLRKRAELEQLWVGKLGLEEGPGRGSLFSILQETEQRKLTAESHKMVEQYRTIQNDANTLVHTVLPNVLTRDAQTVIADQREKLTRQINTFADHPDLRRQVEAVQNHWKQNIIARSSQLLPFEEVLSAQAGANVQIGLKQVLPLADIADVAKEFKTSTDVQVPLQEMKRINDTYVAARDNPMQITQIEINEAIREIGTANFDKITKPAPEVVSQAIVEYNEAAAIPKFDFEEVNNFLLKLGAIKNERDMAKNALIPGLANKPLTDLLAGVFATSNPAPAPVKAKMTNPINPVGAFLFRSAVG